MIPFWVRWRREDATAEQDTEAEAFWIVLTVDGGIRYVRVSAGGYAVPAPAAAGFVVLGVREEAAASDSAS